MISIQRKSPVSVLRFHRTNAIDSYTSSSSNEMKFKLTRPTTVARLHALTRLFLNPRCPSLLPLCPFPFPFPFSVLPIFFAVLMDHHGCSSSSIIGRR